MTKQVLKGKLQINELEEIRNDAYNCAKSYKDRMKRVHDKNILRKSFELGQKVLLEKIVCISSQVSYDLDGLVHS